MIRSKMCWLPTDSARRRTCLAVYGKAFDETLVACAAPCHRADESAALVYPWTSPTERVASEQAGRTWNTWFKTRLRESWTGGRSARSIPPTSPPLCGSQSWKSCGPMRRRQNIDLIAARNHGQRANRPIVMGSVRGASRSQGPLPVLQGRNTEHEFSSAVERKGQGRGRGQVRNRSSDSSRVEMALGNQ